MGGWLLLNPRSGDGSDVDDLREKAEAHGVEIRLLGPEEDAAALAREARADVLGAAGGDGTLAAVAAAALERGLPFVCVPFGTRNHFARDLGLDRGDPAAALTAFAGVERTVDVGRANGRVFLNNVSFGAYAVLVDEGWRRLLDAVRLRHRLLVDGRPIRTRVLLVANNAYSFTGVRERLDEGLLHVYTPGGELCVARRVVVEAHSPRLRTAIDGERAVLESPITLEIEPAALRMLVPRGPDA